MALSSNCHRAFSKGHNVYALILKLTLEVNQIEDFSKLPIPFFCIATNIENGEQVVLEKGNLAQSIVASGALPSLFQPVFINDTMLIDGGVVNNYPIEELREKGMDVIIGVDVQDGLADRKELESAPEVLMQISNFRTINAMKSKVPKTDVYIKPNIKDYNVMSFNEGHNIIAKGREAALSKVNILKTLADKKEQQAKSSFRPKPIDSIKINSFKIEGNEKYTRAYILGKLKFKSNEKISYDDFNKGIYNLAGTNNFDAFQYQLKKDPKDEGYHFEAHLKESKINTFLKLGLHYDNLYKSAVLFNLTKKRLLFKNDVASLDIVLGDNVRYNFDYLIDKGFYWSIGLRSRFNQFHKSVNAQLLLNDDQMADSGLNKIDVELQDQTNQFYLQTLFCRDFSLRMGLEHKRLEVKSETIIGDDPDDSFLFEKTDYFSLMGNLKLDTYDSKYFPRQGLYLNGNLNVYLYGEGLSDGFEDFSVAKANIGYALGLTDKLALNVRGSGGFKFGDKSNQMLNFALGGYGSHLINNFVPFLGYDFLSLPGNSYVKTWVTADYEIYKKHHIMLDANWANIGDNIFDNGEWFTMPDYSGYALGYAVETLLGPVQVKYSYSPEQKSGKWFFNVGFWF